MNDYTNGTLGPLVLENEFPFQEDTHVCPPDGRCLHCFMNSKGYFHQWVSRYSSYWISKPRKEPVLNQFAAEAWAERENYESQISLL